MTTTSHVPRSADEPAGGDHRRSASEPLDGPVTLPRVIASEWLKFRTLRSTVALLAAAVVGMVVLGAVIAHNTRDPAGLDPEDVVASGPLQGYYLGQLLIGALGVLVVSGEYSTGMIRATLAAVPRRLPVLLGKVVVLVAVVGTAMIAASVVAFLVAQAFLSGYRPTYSLGDPSTLRVVVGTGTYLTLVGLLGSGLAWIIRSTPGALVAVVGAVLVLPVLFEVVLPSWGGRIAAWLPTGAGASFSTDLAMPHALSPWAGLAVMVAWVVLALVAGAVTLQRRDA